MSDYLRTIDALVAEKVIGWTVKPGQIGTSHSVKGHFISPVDVPRYSTEIAAAWEVVERFLPMQLEFTIGKWECWSYAGEKLCSAEAGTAPLAICLAALKSVGVEVPE